MVARKIWRMSLPEYMIPGRENMRSHNVDGELSLGFGK